MMLLEYAVWGAWAAVAGKYFIDPPPHGLGFTGAQSGLLFSMLPLGAILAPLVVGQLADRSIRSERLQGALCLGCAAVLIFMGQTKTFGSFLGLMAIYSALFAATPTLTNAIAFAHLADPAREFGPVRAGGTLGWFVALGCLAGWRAIAGETISGDLFYLAAGFSVLLGIYSFTLPATHPPKASRALPFLDALGMLRDRNFCLFFILSFVLGAMLDFYYIFASAYLGAPSALGGVGIPASGVPLLMMIPPGSELLIMFALGSLLPRFGIKRALILGFAAWTVRFGLLAAQPSPAFAVGALAVHGIAFTFVFAVASLYVHQIAPPGIRASAQAMVTLGLIGFGRFAGAQLAGFASSKLTRPVSPPLVIGDTAYSHAMNWTALFAIPCVIVALATLVLVWQFREPTAAT